jgi:hypothetical protein
MVKLFFPLRVATNRQFPLPVRYNDYENRELLENGGSSTRNVYRTPIANQGLPIEWSSYFRHAAPPSGSFRFRFIENRGLLENGGSWMRKVYRTPIANRGRPIEWWSYFRHASPPSGSFRFWSVHKSWITRERWQLDEKCLQNTNSKSGSAYQMVKLLQLGGATCFWFPLWVRFATFKSAIISETVKAGWDVAK